MTKLSRQCEMLCVRTYTDDELAEFAQRIADKYRVNWYAARFGFV